MQNCSNSSANALELTQSCIKHSSLFSLHTDWYRDIARLLCRVELQLAAVHSSRITMQLSGEYTADLILLSSCGCLSPIHWNQVLSREWRCTWVYGGMMAGPWFCCFIFTLALLYTMLCIYNFLADLHGLFAHITQDWFISTLGLWYCCIIVIQLTQWGSVMHVWVSKLNIIGSDNGLLPGWYKPLSEPVLEYC